MNKPDKEKKYYHHTETLKIYEQVNHQSIENLWYKMHYFQQFQRDKNGELKVKVHQELPIKKEEKFLWAKRVEEQRLRGLLDCSTLYAIRMLEGKLANQLVHGLGGGHITETSLTIHPLYGIPYIPGSSIKGVVRHWVEKAFNEKEEINLIDDKNLIRWHQLIFGDQKNRGFVQFHDVFVYEDLKVNLDIMTPHHTQYYQGKKEATDEKDTNIVNFYTVHASKVRLVVSLFKVLPEDLEVSLDQLFDVIVAWTIKALTELGIGSKTSSGYGLFSEVSDKTEEKINPKLDKLQDQKNQEIEQHLMDAMNPRERLIYEIQQLTDTTIDCAKSKNEIFNKVVAMNDPEVAQELKAFWERIGDWNVKKKKQRGKVENIKQIIDQSI